METGIGNLRAYENQELVMGSGENMFVDLIPKV
jgi:hypothetical protein